MAEYTFLQLLKAELIYLYYKKAQLCCMSNFYLPVEMQDIISQYSKPLTRPDYKRGSFMMRSLVVNKYNIYKNLADPL